MCTHKVDIPLNAIVEVVLVDEVQQDNLSHPFHLHGYSFNVIGMGRSPDTTIKKISLKHALDLDRRGLLHRHFKGPPLKDTIAVPNNGYVVLRFRADNPGWVGKGKSFWNLSQIKFYTKFQWKLLATNIEKFPSVMKPQTNFNSFFSILFLQSVAFPLSLPLPCRHRNESHNKCGHTSRFTASAAKLPNVRSPSTANKNSLVMFSREIFRF